MILIFMMKKMWFWITWTLSTVKWNQNLTLGLHVSGRMKRSYSFSVMKSIRPRFPYDIYAKWGFFMMTDDLTYGLNLFRRMHRSINGHVLLCPSVRAASWQLVRCYQDPLRCRNRRNLQHLQIASLHDSLPK